MKCDLKEAPPLIEYLFYQMLPMAHKHRKYITHYNSIQIWKTVCNRALEVRKYWPDQNSGKSENI